MSFSDFFYEMKPYLCLAGAAFALCQKDPSPFLIVAAMTLLTAGAWILRARWRVRGRGTPLESQFYELQPYLLIGLGILAMAVQKTSKLTIAFSLALMFCATMILKWRRG